MEPGSGLGKKDKKPGKHVMIAEAMNIEYVMPAETFGEDPPEPHEISAVSAVKGLPTSTLSEALSMQTSTAVPEKPQQIELASDKRLVGALDSACNRTVAGPTWLSGFLNELKKAPADVRALVKRQQEHELFRFGNGGVQRSLERWRLSMVLGDQLFVFWTSVVDVPSLGLLFGRDYLDGIRAVLNFNRRLLRCDRLRTGHIPLRQLAAGHFLLEIIPRAWIRPGSQRWRKFGQDGVVELQLSFGGWLKQKFGHASQGFPKEHEHLVTESSVCAADLANSGFCQSTTARPTLPTLARDVMSTSASAISPSRNGREVRKASSAGEMASDGAAPVSAKRMARPRAAALAFAATIAALGACSIPSDQRHHAMASTGREHGGQWQSGKAPFDQGATSWSLHGAEPQGCSVPSKPDGFQFGFHGRSATDWNAGGSSNQGLSKQDPSGCNSGSSKGGQASQRRREADSRSSRADWSQRRIASPSTRPSALGNTATCGDRRGGHHGKAERKMSPSCRFADGQDKACQGAGSQRKAKQIFQRFLSRAKGKISSAFSHLDRRSQQPISSTSSSTDGISGKQVSNDAFSGDATCEPAEQHQPSAASRREPRRLHGKLRGGESSGGSSSSDGDDWSGRSADQRRGGSTLECRVLCRDETQHLQRPSTRR